MSSFYDALWKRKLTSASQTLTDRESSVLPFIPPGSRVLDLGCGTGTLLAHAQAPHIAVGVDLGASAIRAAKSRGLEAARSTLEGAFLPFKDGSFDRITCLHLIEHLFDPRPLLTEAYRVLCSGGLLVLLTPNVRYHYHLVRLVIRGRGPRTSGDPEGVDGGHVHYFTHRDVEELLRDAGFDPIDLRGTGGVKWLPSFRSPEVLAAAYKGT